MNYVIYTHLKIVFGLNPKTNLPEYNCNQDLVFWKAKNQNGFSISKKFQSINPYLIQPSWISSKKKKLQKDVDIIDNVIEAETIKTILQQNP